MSTPKVSVLLATYNRGHLIHRAIESVLRQTFRDWELVIADDGSTDNTREVAEAFVKRDERIRYFPREHAGQIAVVSNYGMKYAQGKYVAIIDDDDAWSDPEKLEKQAVFLDTHPDYVGVGGGYVIVDDKGNEKARLFRPEKDEVIRRRLLFANQMVNSTTMFRRNTAQKIGFYDESLLEFADWDFWLKMGLHGKLYNFPEYFVYYMMWDKSASFSRQRRTAKSGLRIVHRHRNAYPGFFAAIALAYLYFAYVHLPGFVKKFLNGTLSRLKKFLFSR